jgi:hypothetical protein
MPSSYGKGVTLWHGLTAVTPICYYGVITPEEVNMETTENVITAEWRVGAYVVRAEYFGGAYIELTMPECIEPTEVINVWDYEKGEASIPFSYWAVASELAEWCEETFGGEDGAYNLRAYIENACW